MSDERLDGLFMNAVQASQGIDNFFDNLFGFMCRKTDLFSQESKAYEMINKYAHKHMEVYKKNVEDQRKIAARRAEEKARQEQLAKEKAEKDEAQVTELTAEEAELLEREEAAKKENPAAAAQLEKEGEEVKQEEGEEKKEDKGQKPNTGNGGETDKYYWEQTIDELTVNVYIPKEIKAKMLDVDIQTNKLRVAIKGQSEAIIDGELWKAVKIDDCLWSIDKDQSGKRVLQLSLTKRDGMAWWDCVIKGDTKIDTSVVNPENSKLSDLDGETRGVVEKMMFDQQQKQKGLPTSDEIEKRNKLQEFMKAHPEMDFSKAKIM